MNIKKFGSQTAEEILELEQKLGFKLPEDYVRFLMATNGGGFEDIDFGKLYVEELEETVYLDAFFGNNVPRGCNILVFTNMFKSDMFENCVVIGSSIEHGLIILMTEGEDKGVYFWDHTYAFEQSNDEINTYFLADTFTDFIELLGK